MEDAVIVATARTPIGRAVKGSLKEERADDLVGFIIADLMSKVPQVDGADIEDVICGVADANRPAEPQPRPPGRSQLGGLPNTVPGTTVQRACASSLQAIRVAAHAIRSGEGDCFVASGVEAVSQFYEAQDPGNPRFMDENHADYLDDFYIPMGMTAENVAEMYDISRERMDEYAALSQNRAVAARANGFWENEITPYPLADGTMVTQDDGPREGTTVEGLGQLQPVFKPDGPSPPATPARSTTARPRCV